MAKTAKLTATQIRDRQALGAIAGRYNEEIAFGSFATSGAQRAGAKSRNF